MSGNNFSCEAQMKVSITEDVNVFDHRESSCEKWFLKIAFQSYFK